MAGYYRIERKTFMIPDSMITSLMEVESDTSWRTQAGMYGRLFTLGLLAYLSLDEIQRPLVIYEAERSLENGKAALVKYLGEAE